MHTHKRETMATKLIHWYEHPQNTMTGKAWDLVRAGSEANTSATISAVISSCDKSEKKRQKNGLRLIFQQRITSTANNVSEFLLLRVPESSASSEKLFSAHLNFFPPYPCRATSLSSSLTFRFQPRNEDADMSSSSSYEVMSSEPEVYDYDLV